MRHRQVGIDHIKLVNGDGHAIGLDIGATAVRAAILAPGTVDGRPSVTVHGLGHVELPDGAVVNGVVRDPTTVTRAIKDLWHQNHFACRNVILGVTNPQVVVREVILPNLPAAQRALALPFQARDIIALPIEQAILDFAPVGAPDPLTDTVAGLLIAAPREPVSVAVGVVEAAGLKVARVDLASFAALRSVADEYCAIGAVVDLGAHLTNIVIHHSGVPQLIRTMVRGGQDLTDKLASQLGVDRAAAERAKRAVGLTGSDPTVSESLTELIRPLLAEIRSSIHLFGSTHGGAAPEQISLTGGGAALPGLPQALADLLGIGVVVAAPMRHVSNRFVSKPAQDVDAQASVTAVSVGLAMGAAA
jgi:type IV pilus assembly protein PilM